MRLIKQTYDITTPESAEQGDFAERGWIDEEGAEIAPDSYDIDEYDDESAAAVALAVKHLRDNGATEASSSHWHSGVWYTSYGEQDYRDGSYTNNSFHLYWFSADEERQIFQSMTRRQLA